MAERLKKPTDPYDPAWVEYAAQNPGIRRSLSAADPGEGDPGDEGAIDLGTFVPESFKGKDGKFDTEAFRASYDDLASFKAIADETKAGLPQKPEEYEAVLGEDFKLLEGFDPETLATTDEQGNKIEFDAASMIDKDDPDLKSLQSMLHEAGAPKALMSKLMGVVVNRELRSVMAAQAQAAEQMKALGPEGKARIGTVTRTLGGLMPKAQVDAILDGITSADALRGVETLLRGKSTGPVNPANPAPNYTDMNPMDRVMAGLAARDKKRA